MNFKKETIILPEIKQEAVDDYSENSENEFQCLAQIEVGKEFKTESLIDERTDDSELPASTIDDETEILQKLKTESSATEKTPDHQERVIDLKNKLIHCTRCNKTWDYPKKAVTKCLLCKSALMYKCRACISKIYSSARSLEGHLYRYHNKREEFHCDQCNYKTYAKNYLRHHIVTRHLPLDPNSQNKCENCGRTYSFRSGLTYHLKTCGQPVSKLVSLICDDCGYKCRQKNQLVRHVQSKHLNETYECTACGKSFKSESNLFEHSRYSCKSSAISKRLSCRLCVFKFASEVHLQNHMQTRHKNVSKSSSKKKLNLTSRVQTNNPPRYLNMRKCRKCGKSYANGSSFRAHVTVCSEPIS